MKTYRSRVCQNAGCRELTRVLANAATMRQVNAHPPVVLRALLLDEEIADERNRTTCVSCGRL
ncbi:MAG TPA: hypothetical protein VMM76_14245 [Pirellulaceae bacterium]|nr:hypothetical protein [Pirellulaceae bacterium]